MDFNEKEVEELFKKYNKTPKWHNLQENPYDVPMAFKTVLLRMSSHCGYCVGSIEVQSNNLGWGGYGEHNRKHDTYFFRSHGAIVCVDSWCELPYFDEGYATHTENWKQTAAYYHLLEDKDFYKLPKDIIARYERA